MNKKICGIYKITNVLNNKSYIGQSMNIYKRWSDHRANIKHRPETLYKAFRKYGINNFTFQIIEECPPEQLNEKEIFWIKFYDSYYTGYNETPGGTFGSKNQRIVSEKDVIEIRTRELKGENLADVHKDFSYINYATFAKIWKNESYQDVYVEGFTEENRKKIMLIAKRNKSAARKNSKMTEDLVLQIRIDKKNNIKRSDAYRKYEQYFTSIGSFDSIWYNKRWKDIQP